MNILLIGNGFDRAHDLPTSYVDFLGFLYFLGRENNLSFIQELDIRDDISSIMNIKNENKRIEISNIKKFKEEVFLDLLKKLESNNLFLHFITTKYKGNWVDLEAEIHSVLGYLHTGGYSNAFKYINKIFNKHIHKITNEELSTALNNLYMNLENIIELLDYYLAYYVNEINCTKRIDFISKLDIEYLISFNYTNTYERLYDNSIKYKHYIHGVASIKSSLIQSNMIVGVLESKSGLDRKFYKYYQRIIKKTGAEYKKWLFDSEHKQQKNEIDIINKQLNSTDIIDHVAITKELTHNLYIFGHSISKPDHDILRDLILSNNMYTTIYYHDQESFHSLVNNFVDMVSQELAIELTYNHDPKVQFVLINDAILKSL